MTDGMHVLTGLALAALALLASACTGNIEMGPDEEPPVDPGETIIDPERTPVGPSELEPGRRVRRLSADQLFASLEVATGQRWSDAETFAGSLGRADYVEVTEEGRELNVTFDKLASDAARATCRDAMNNERDGSAPGVLLRHATLEDRAEPALRANLRYLLLRFFGARVSDDADPRLDPFLPILTTSASGEAITDDSMARRWEAVCVALATHPDFLTY